MILLSFDNLVSVDPRMFTVGISDILYTSLTASNVSNVCTCPFHNISEKYVIDQIHCDQQYLIGRFGYVIGNTSTNYDNEIENIQVKKLEMFTDECT